MSERDPDVIVIGSGPNGLVLACTLARLGFRVLVVEENPRRPGGALGSEELTRPGFVHDVGAAFFPFAKSSPAFASLDLAARGVQFEHARFESCHPALDGSYACLSRDLEDEHFGSPSDSAVWQALARWHARVEPELLEGLLGPVLTISPLLRLGVGGLLKLARIFLSKGGALSQRLFQTEAARRVMPGLALHADVGPYDRFGAGIGYMLAAMATSGGFAVPRGGAQAITNALVTILEAHGGHLQLGSRVSRVLVDKGRAVGVQLANGEELRAARAVAADTGAPALFLDLLEQSHVPARVVSKMQRFPWGFGTFKVDWALSAPVPWTVAAARESAVVHVGESLEDLNRYTREVRAGRLPEQPYLVVGQQSLVDPTRAPRNQHTLYCYTHVPAALDWERQREIFAARIEARLEQLAPGFSTSVLARSIHAPPDLEAGNANLVGGDLGGGSSAYNHQLVFRPVFPYFRYRTPVKRLYLCSSFTHPGTGVHGMCGYNAAQRMARDLS
jgi:phytoene dehydrogenase-like protein